MVHLVTAVRTLVNSAPASHAIVGGIAVTARLGGVHRSTADVDSVIAEDAFDGVVEAILSDPTAELQDRSTSKLLVSGTVLELLPVGRVTDTDTVGMPDDDALFVLGHAWALQSATELTIVATDNPGAQATARVATPAALFAMKLHAIEDRSGLSQNKRGSDGWDLFRLMLDLDTNGALRRKLALASPRLQQLVHASGQRFLVDEATRTAGWIRSSTGNAATAEEIRSLASPLLAALAG
jgi:hypothetical protein